MASRPIIGSTGTPTSSESSSTAGACGRDRPVAGPARQRAGQIGLVEHRQQRLPGRGDRVGVLGFDHFGGDVNDDVDVLACGALRRVHDDPRLRRNAVKRCRHGVAPHSSTATDGHPQRRGGPLGDRRHAGVSVTGGESLQLVDKNLVPLSLHVRAPRPARPDPQACVAPAGSAVSTAASPLCRTADRVPPNGGT